MAKAENKLHATKDDAGIKAQVKQKLSAFEATTLFYLAVAVACLYTARATALYLFLPFDEALTYICALVPSIVYSLTVTAAYKLNKIPNTKIRLLIVILGSLITFNVFYLLHITGDHNQFYFACIVLIAFGIGSPTFQIWLLFAISFITAYVTSLLSLGVEEIRPYLAILVASIALSSVVYFIRVPTIRKLLELQIIHAANARELELSIKARDQFLANMTHELRTPMTGVLGMIDLMADTKLTKEQKYYLGTARKSARYLLTVINDILDVAKLESGKVVISREIFDATALSNDIAVLFELRAKQKGLKLQLELPEQGTLPVRGDTVRISQILLNLLENALKFTNNGEIKLSLETEITAIETTLTWSVEDTGIGIESSRLPELFDRFEQVDSSATRTTHGTGLGLAIIYDLVHLMNGDLGATSTLGKGSRFWFTLTLPTEGAENLPKDAVPSIPEHFSAFEASEFLDPTPSGHPECDNLGDADHKIRILFAEDNPVNRELIGRLIKREGWHGTSVINGQEALDTFSAKPDKYDLILMDIQMPVLDGLSALKIIKEQYSTAPPVIALTANTLPDDLRQYEEAGFDAIVGKPINIIELRATVEQLARKP